MSTPLFNPEEYAGHARITSGPRTEMEQALADDVYGQRVTKIETVRKFDPEATKKYGKPVEYVEVAVYLENNIVYLARTYVTALSIVQRGDGLANVQPGDPNYFIAKDE